MSCDVGEATESLENELCSHDMTLRKRGWSEKKKLFVLHPMTLYDAMCRSHSFSLTRKVFGFEQTYMCDILVTGPLGTSECAGECRFSENLCKRALDVTAGVIVEATHNADILNINANSL